MAPAPVLLPGESHGWRSLVGYSPGGREESDKTERLHFHFSLFTFMHWRRKWQPIPVFLPGESQGWWGLVGCRLRGRTESDTTEVTQQQQLLSSAHFLNVFKFYYAFIFIDIQLSYNVSDVEQSSSAIKKYIYRLPWWLNSKESTVSGVQQSDLDIDR